MKQAANLRSAVPTPPARVGRARPDYRSWSVEELRALARQLQVPGAAGKSRMDLLRLFGAS